MSIGEAELDIECPKCRFMNSITVHQIVQRDAVICRGCHITLRLDDHMNEARKLERRFSQFLNDMAKMFKG